MIELLHTPEKASGGQVGSCVKCGKHPVFDKTKGSEHEVYDGCIGKLNGDVMNACCGHGDIDLAYVQFLDLTRISGKEAVIFMGKN